MSDANKVLKQMKENGAKYLDLRFTDPRGKLQHLTMDGTAVDEFRSLYPLPTYDIVNNPNLSQNDGY